jgi:hypothetical protein
MKVLMKVSIDTTTGSHLANESGHKTQWVESRAKSTKKSQNNP